MRNRVLAHADVRALLQRAPGLGAGRVGHQHAFALEPAELAAHPEWQLHGHAATRRSTSASRAAADFGNPAFRAWWIARAQAALAAGYRGLFIDDVFMERRTTTLAAASPRNADRPAHRHDDDRGELAALHGRLHGRGARRAADAWRSSTTCSGTRATRRRAARPAGRERTSRSTAASTHQSSTASTYGSQTLAGWIEREQARGGARRSSTHPTTPRRRAPLRPRHLPARRQRRVRARQRRARPRRARSGPATTSTSARRTTARYQVTTGVWRRDFTRGIVLVNEPYRGTRTVTAPGRLPGPRRRPALVGHARRRPGRGARPDPAAGRRPRRPTAGRHPRPGSRRPGLDVHPGAGHAARRRRRSPTVSTGGNGAAKPASATPRARAAGRRRRSSVQRLAPAA